MKIRNPKTYFLLFILVALLTSCGGITPVPKFTPTPRRTAAPTFTPRPKTEVIEPENVDKLQIVEKWGNGNIFGVTLSPDESTIALSTGTGVYFYDAESLQQTQFLDLPIRLKPMQSHWPTKAISFSPDGKLFAVIYDNNIVIRDLLGNKFDKRIDNRIANYQIVQIVYSPLGNTIAVMSMGSYTICDAWGGNFALYNIESGNLLYNDFFCPESALFHFTFLDNGNVAFVGINRDDSNWAYRTSIVDGNTGALVKRFSHQDHVDNISPDGSKISVRRRDPDGTDILDTKTEKPVDKLDGIVIFLPGNQNQWVATKDDWKIITNDHKTICNFESRPSLILDVYRSTFTLIHNKLIFWDSWHQNIEVWDMAQCKLLKQWPLPTVRAPLVYSNDGSLLATHSLSNVYLFNGEHGEYKFSIPGTYNVSPRKYYDFSTDSKMLVVVSDTNPYTITFWDTASGKQLQSIPTEFEYFSHVAFISGNTTIATEDIKGLHFWDIKSQKLLNTLPVRADLYFNAEKNFFAQRDDDSLVFRRIKNGTFKNKIVISKDNFGIAFSSDWTYLAVKKEKIELWDIDGYKLRELMEYPPLDPTIKPSSSITYDIKFSPNNHILAAIRPDDENSIICFWDTRTGTIIREIKVPFYIFSMAFNPDGKRLAVTGYGMIYIFGINPSQ